MNLKKLILLGLALALFCLGYLTVRGRTMVVDVPLADGPQDIQAYTVTVESDNLSVTDQKIRDGVLRLTLRGEKPGATFIEVDRGDTAIFLERFLIHPTHLITRDTYFGECTGGRVVPIAVALYVAVLFVSLLRRYRADVRRDMYQYRNVLELGVLVLLGAVLLDQTLTAVRYSSVVEAVYAVLNSVRGISIFTLPAAFVLSILITISNLRLMRREGRTWRNMLGCILGVLLCLSTLLPDAMSYYFQFINMVIDVHNERSIWMYLEMGVEQTIVVIVAYLECILIGTILFGLKAARHVPPYDREYMMILGSQIRADGTLPPLLQARVDRAVAFAERQEAETGKQLVFVPSGGQGRDEVMPEGEAMRRYLIECGIPDDRILPETKSTNTEQNLRFSAELIRAREDGGDAKLAFSTTNYHVFRAGMLASGQGIRAEGVGSPTKRYYWINAFVREFIATLYSERRTHIVLLALLLLASYAMIAVVYFSNIM